MKNCLEIESKQREVWSTAVRGKHNHRRVGLLRQLAGTLKTFGRMLEYIMYVQPFLVL